MFLPLLTEPPRRVLLGIPVSGKSYSRKLRRHVRLDHAGLRCELVRIYTGSKFNGYVFKLTNYKRKSSFAFDLPNLTLGSPNTAILSQLDRKILNVRGSNENVTYLRIVAKPASQYHDVKLPVGTLKGGGT